MGARLGKDRVPHLGPASLVGEECRAKEKISGGCLACSTILGQSGLVRRREICRMWLLNIDGERCPVISRGIAEADIDQSPR